ncbi:MAG: Kef-type K+ transport system membrane component KefB, partial [Bacteriovoracaceae bacterium]
MDTFYFLIATLALVPLFKRLELGSMLGYIVAGILIGPMCLGLIDSSKSIVQLAELGITLLLFIVGLELSPARLKQLRKNIILEGGLQVTLTTLVFFFI